MTSTRLSSDERRLAIVAVAVPLFATKGFDALTTKEIADAAGISEALLYRHFESKQALFHAVQATCVAEAAEEARRLETLPDNTSTLVLAIYVLCGKIQNCLHPEKAERNEVTRLVMRSLLDDGEFARGFLAETSGAWVRKIEKCVSAAIAAGDLQDSFEGSCLGVWFAHHLSAAINFFRLPGRGKVVPYPVDEDEIFERSVMFCLRGIGFTADAIARYYNPKAFALLQTNGG
jgi:AcrR family transcriptional regulator